MRVVFAGTPEAAVPSLAALLASTHEVLGVITRPDARSGRGRTLRPSPVRVAAEEAGLPVLTPASARDPELRETLARWAPEACPVVAYGALIPPALLDLPTHGWINLHFSLLPAWRGAAPVQHAIIAGDEVTGASTFLIEEGLDTGPVFGTLTETIRPTDTAQDLLDRLSEAGAGLLVATLDGLATGQLTGRPQPADGISLAPKLEVADGRLDWHRPAYAVDRLVRGCTPAPGAWTTFRGERLKVHPVRPLAVDADDAAPLLPGQVRVDKRSVRVGTGAGAVELGDVQAPGKRVMAALDWARGARPGPEEVLGG